MEKVKAGAETLLYPMPAALVGTNVEGKANFMTAAWCGIAASTPPAITVGVQRARYTYKGIQANDTFSINIPSVALARETDYCGIYSGRRDDKSGIFEVEYGILKNAPLIKECPVSLECKVLHTLDLGSHVLFVGEIVESYVRADCMTEGKPDPVKIDPLIYATAGQTYHRLGEVVGKAFRIGKK